MNRNSDEISQPSEFPKQEEKASTDEQSKPTRKTKVSSRSPSTQESISSSSSMNPSKKRKWKRPKDMPKRPLSAYNIFFHYERERLMEENESKDSKSNEKLASDEKLETGSKGKARRNIGFVNLSRTVATRWRALDPEAKIFYEKEAEKEQARYEKEIGEWKRAATASKPPEYLQQGNTLPSIPYGGFSPPHTTFARQESEGTAQSMPPTVSLQQLLRLGLPQSMTEHPAFDQSMNPHTLNQSLESMTYFSPVAEPQANVVPTTVPSLPPDASRQTYDSIPPVHPISTSASLQQLFAELDEEEQEFLVSLRRAP